MSTAVIKPWSAQVELTAGCQLRCPFCGINALPWKQGEVVRALSVEQAAEIEQVYRYQGQIEALKKLKYLRDKVNGPS